MPLSNSTTYTPIASHRSFSPCCKIISAISFLIAIFALTFLIYYITIQLNFDDDDSFTEISPILNFSSFVSNSAQADDSKAIDETSKKVVFHNKECGKQNSITRVQHGDKTLPFEFPWMAAIFALNKTTNKDIYVCGGSLINDTLILTAAHCVIETANIKLNYVRLGEQNFETDEDCIIHNHGSKECATVQDIFDFTIIIHPNYDSELKVNDIALIKLNQPANLEKKNIGIICLPLNDSKLPKKVVVTGFGLIEYGKFNAELRKASLNVVPNDQCERDYKEFDKNVDKKLADTQFCAISHKNKEKNGVLKTYDVDTCRGDSGSPVQFGSPTSSQFVQYGIVSGGYDKPCGNKTAPGIYTKVYDYLGWILDNSV